MCMEERLAALGTKQVLAWNCLQTQGQFSSAFSDPGTYSQWGKPHSSPLFMKQLDLSVLWDFRKTDSFKVKQNKQDGLWGFLKRGPEVLNSSPCAGPRWRAGRLGGTPQRFRRLYPLQNNQTYQHCASSNRRDSFHQQLSHAPDSLAHCHPQPALTAVPIWLMSS